MVSVGAVRTCLDVHIEISGRGLTLSPELEQHADKRLHFALSRFSNRIRAVKVLLEDVNGPRGGIDKHCSLTVKLDHGDELRVEDEGSDVLSLLDHAADRLGRLVARELERQREAAAGRHGRLVTSR